MIALTSLVCLLATATSAVPEENASLALPNVNSAVIVPAPLSSPEAIEKENLESAELDAQLIPPSLNPEERKLAKLDTKVIKTPIDEEAIQIQKVSQPIAAEEANAAPALTPADESTRHVQINMQEVFAGAPIIYSLLFLMSLGAFTLWIYHVILSRSKSLMPVEFADSIEDRLAVGNWQEALALCRKEKCLLATLVQAAISARHEGSHAMIDRMTAEGKRATSFFWQRLSLLNDIALIAPMIGLLGTVVGMFYAFYDVNRSVDSMYALFDGLGISVGTTVAGLVLAILALFFHSTLKYRLVRQLSTVEAKAQKIALHPSAHQAAAPNFQMRDSHEFNT